MTNVVNLYKKLIPDDEWSECDELSKDVAVYVYDHIKEENGRNAPVVLAMALGRTLNALEKLGLGFNDEELEMIQVVSTGKGLR